MAAAEAPGLAGNSADRTRDVRTITTVVTEVLSANPEATPLDIETALRAAFGQAYVVANSTPADFEIVLKHDEIRFDSLNF